MKDEKVSDFSKRLSYAMDIRNMKQVDLVEKTGIKKASISHYVRGVRTGVSLNVVQTIAQVLEVNPIWLLGYDVPMESRMSYSKDSANFLMDSFADQSTREVMEIMNRLNSDGKNQVLQYSLFVLNQSQYQK